MLPVRTISRKPVDSLRHLPFLLAAVWMLAVRPAMAQAPPPTGLWKRGNLLGDLFGLRPLAADHGVAIGLQETSELLANVTGGLRTGPAYDGLTQLGIGLDTGRAFGWRGGTFNVSAFWIHGRSLSQDNLGQSSGGIVQTVSGIEAERSFRLWEAWYDQATPDGRLDLKIGQQSLDQEFITSSYTSLFINTMMGWPAVPSYDMYAGGPAYPLSSPGARLRGSAGPLTALLGVFDDNPPSGRFSDDDQLRGRERSGTDFDLHTGVLVFGELQFVLDPAPADPNAQSGKGGLPGTYRVGAWYDSGEFPDPRYDSNGVSLADPASNGMARMRRHDFGIYTSCDQQLWQDKSRVRALGVFARLMGAPGDRNLVSFSTNLGISLKAPLAARPSDTIGLGYGLARISSRASGLDQDMRSGGDVAYPIRSTESFIELTYQAQVAPWWTLQPDLQYVFTPGGGITDPGAGSSAATYRISNEVIVGIRTNVTF